MLKAEGKFCVYVLKNPMKDGAIFYVGKTANIEKRMAEHIYESGRGKRSHKKNTIRKILRSGLEVGYRKLAQFDTEEKAFEFEKKIISILGRKNLTNATDGGDGGAGAFLGKKHTAETKKKMSLAKKGYVPWMGGKTHNEETREKMRAAWKRHTPKQLEERKKKFSMAGKKRAKENPFTEEIKNKISISMKKYWADKKALQEGAV